MSYEYKEVEIPWPQFDASKGAFIMEGVDVTTAQVGYWMEYQDRIMRALKPWNDIGWELDPDAVWLDGVIIKIEVGHNSKPYALPVRYRAKLRRLKDGDY